MPRRNKIRWRESDHAELNRLVKNFNAKLTRIAKSNPDALPYMPERVSKKDLVNQIATRGDLKAIQRKLSNFTKRGAEEVLESKHGAKASRWEVEEFKNNQRIENIRRAKRRKELGEQDVKIGGQTTGVKRKEMGSIKENAVQPSKKKFDAMTQSDWKKATKLFDKLILDSYSYEKQQRYKDNYIKGLVAAGFPKQLIEIVENVPLEKFLEVIDTDETATFDFIYDPNELAVKADYMMDAWKAHSKGAS